MKSELLSNRHTDTQTKYCNPRCACESGLDGMVAWWGLTLANGASTPSTIARPSTLFYVRRLTRPLSFTSGDLRRRFLPAADRAGALSVYTPYYGVRIMLITGPSQSVGSIPCGLFCSADLKLIWTTSN